MPAARWLHTRYSFTAENWTVSGIKSLSVWFFGDPDNTGQLYVKINDMKILYDGDPVDRRLSLSLAMSLDEPAPQLMIDRIASSTDMSMRKTFSAVRW